MTQRLPGGFSPSDKTGKRAWLNRPRQVPCGSLAAEAEEARRPGVILSGCNLPRNLLPCVPCLFTTQWNIQAPEVHGFHLPQRRKRVPRGIAKCSAEARFYPTRQR